MEGYIHGLMAVYHARLLRSLSCVLGAHTSERELVCGYEREKWKGDKQREKKEEGEREIERKKRKRQKAEMTRARDHEGRILYVQIVRTRAISYASQRILLQSNDLINIYNGSLLIVSPLIALCMSLYVRS